MSYTMLVTALIGVVIGLVVLTSLGNTVITNTATNAFNSTGADNPAGQLENASATGKTMYSLLELLYPIMGVIFLVSVGFALRSRL